VTKKPLFAIGHSTRPFDEFAELLRRNGIRVLADIRTIPKSRRYPHFADTWLKKNLPKLPEPIEYVHLPGLGGLRKPRPDSPNAGWRNSNFRGYADYMQTEPFEKALEELLTAAERGPLAFMCAEAVPWRCHRSLVADALTARGHEVRQILGPGEPRPHRMTPFAVVRKGKVLYPAEKTQPELL
jgi:uncharacterized protein (DUF488 family)